MSMFVRTGIGLMIALFLAGAATAQQNAVLTLPATGTFARGGEFTGTISINRFELRGNEIFAIGVVAGTLRRGSHALGTAIAGEKAWEVRVGVGDPSLVNGRSPAPARVTQVAWSPGVPVDATLFRAQAQECPVLNVALGPTTVDLLGFQVALSGVTLALTGVEGTPLGDLVCEASKLLGNIAKLVGVLNNILGLLLGLLGGLTGDLGGIVP